MLITREGDAQFEIQCTRNDRQSGGLDVAIDLGIDHGGWKLRGRRTEWTLPEKYKLVDMRTGYQGF